MNNISKICIGVIIVIIALFGIGTLMTHNEVNNNMENVKLTEHCTIKVPQDVKFEKTFGTDEEGTFGTMYAENTNDWGRISIQYEQSNNIQSLNNITKPEQINVDGNVMYQAKIYHGNEKIEIRGDNPAIVEAIAKSVTFN